MGVSTSIRVGGSRFSSSWFTDRDDASGTVHVDAIVLWRGASNDIGSSRFPWGFFIAATILPKSVFRWIFAKRFAAMNPDPGLPEGWTSASGQGANQVLHDRRRRVVGIRSRVFGPPPAGKTLLLLVDEGDDAPHRIRVEELIIDLPAMEDDRSVDRSRPRDEVAREMGDRHRRRYDAWNKALEAEPAYVSFMNRPNPERPL